MQQALAILTDMLRQRSGWHGRALCDAVIFLPALLEVVYGGGGEVRPDLSNEKLTSLPFKFGGQNGNANGMTFHHSI